MANNRKQTLLQFTNLTTEVLGDTITLPPNSFDKIFLVNVTENNPGGLEMAIQDSFDGVTWYPEDEENPVGVITGNTVMADPPARILNKFIRVIAGVANINELQSSYSPLTWNGNTYTAALFGAQAPSVYYLAGEGGFQFVSQDGTAIDIPQNLANAHIHVGLVRLTDGDARFTFFIPRGILTSFETTENAAGMAVLFEDIFGEGAAVVENFKADALEKVQGGYSWEGFTGFDEAGAVAVAEGETSPPTLELVEADGEGDYTGELAITYRS